MSVLISAANRQQLTAMGTGGTAAVVVAFSVTVQQYDTVAAAYFPAFQTRSGSAPGGFHRPAGVQVAADAVYGTVRLTGGAPALQLGGTAVAGLPGAPVFQMDLIVSSAVAPRPQQLQVQTSTVQKVIQTWGLPPS
ncbi:hypothetical protein [Dactylosporangium sp. CA-233914]|uniref:hypothetical protein n=1 Tax=Dactylosporangium sp. CA-233914 TaxID=3239934 RepID=UPI003D8FB70F